MNAYNSIVTPEDKNRSDQIGRDCKIVIYLFFILLIVILAWLSWLDLRTFLLPDKLTLPLLMTGIVQAYWLAAAGEASMAVIASLIGAAIGYLAFFLLEIGFKRLRGYEGLGRGDAKLLAAGGAWCGWSGLPFIVLIASGFGLCALLLPSLRRKWQSAIPFGPFLALAILLVWGANIWVYHLS